MAEAGVARAMENPAAEAGKVAEELEVERERWKPVIGPAL